MDIATHGLASLALLRAVWPRAPRVMWIAGVVAGAVADVDWCSFWAGAEHYLAWRGTYTHALLTAFLLSLVAALAYRSFAGLPRRERFSVGRFFLLIFSAQCLHIALDLCGAMPVAVLWPFVSRRLAADWIVGVDPWIIALLLASLLFPELLRLVTEEIGARSKAPRGRVGALVGFSLIVLYLGVRAEFQNGATALMEARAYHGEAPKHVAAFPESFSPFSWQGLIETERALYRVEVDEGFGGSFDPEDATAIFKPEPSAALDAAEQTRTAALFLQTARFPIATVEGTTTGTRVEIRDLAYMASGVSKREVLAVIDLDRAHRVESERIASRAELEPD
jgi:hypothetical protein